MKLIKLLFLVIIVLVVVNVTLTNRTIDDGIKISNLEKEIAHLQNENRILTATIAKDGSIENLTTVLAESGYVETTKIVSISSGQSLASR